jgi:hypothetical protein
VISGIFSVRPRARILPVNRCTINDWLIEQMFSIHQHWDPLQTCIVGRTLPPEYYSWIKVPHVRSLFERMAIETETGSQLLTNKLQEFGVQVLRPSVDLQYPAHEKNVFVPPLQPRNHMMMIGDKFYYQNWSIL